MEFYNEEEIVEEGGDFMALVLLDDGEFPAALTPGENCIGVGYIEESEDDYNSSKTERKSESKKVRKVKFESTGTVKAKLMQRGALLRKFLAFKVKDKKCLQIKEEGLVDGKYHTRVSLVNVTPQDKVKFAEGTLQFESTDVVSTADFVVSAANITSLESAVGAYIKPVGPITIPANQEFELVETDVD